MVRCLERRTCLEQANVLIFLLFNQMRCDSARMHGWQRSICRKTTRNSCERMYCSDGLPCGRSKEIGFSAGDLEPSERKPFDLRWCAFTRCQQRRFTKTLQSPGMASPLLHAHHPELDRKQESCSGCRLRHAVSLYHAKRRSAPGAFPG